MLEEHGTSRDEVLRRLDQLLEADSTYSSGHPVASMSTIPHSLGTEVFARTLEKNAGRLHTFQGSAHVEREVLEMIGDLLNLESQAFGTTTSGGTESNILAILAYRERAKKKTKTPEIIAPKTAHSSVDKAGWLLGVKVKRTRVDKEFKAIPRAIEKKINENTIGIVLTAGTTYLGQIDPIEQVAEIARDHKIPLHIDAAFGGFVIPFLNEIGRGKFRFAFEVNGVTSVSVDPHKMGLAPIPAGTILFRDKKYVKVITNTVPYLRGASSTQISILGTRPAASILATWAVMRHLGREGYREIVRGCMEQTDHIMERVRHNPMLQAAIEPIMNIVGIESREVPVSTIIDLMEKRGWRMAASPLPPTMRIVVMPHVTRGSINAFFNDLDDVSTTIPP
ncbi:MAG: tyrosine decarboxylase MfnA [Candidatus Thorarchaeota archaeon]|nr:tyrosine decarboxylase MfnA [Candidatus Thorarchaeota archaeon]